LEKWKKVFKNERILVKTNQTILAIEQVFLKESKEKNISIKRKIVKSMY